MLTVRPASIPASIRGGCDELGGSFNDRFTMRAEPHRNAILENNLTSQDHLTNSVHVCFSISATDRISESAHVFQIVGSVLSANDTSELSRHLSYVQSAYTYTTVVDWFNMFRWDSGRSSSKKKLPRSIQSLSEKVE